MATKKGEHFAIEHTIQTHGGTECAAPAEEHQRCTICGACYTCAGVVAAVRRKMGLPASDPASETDTVRIERLVRENLAAAGFETAYVLSGVISVEISGDHAKVVADLGESKWARFEVPLGASDLDVGRQIRSAIVTPSK